MEWACIMNGWAVLIRSILYRRLVGRRGTGSGVTRGHHGSVLTRLFAAGALVAGMTEHRVIFAEIVRLWSMYWK
jgi:hypothetical protein